jgi:hypothetical protein
MRIARPTRLWIVASPWAVAALVAWWLLRPDAASVRAPAPSLASRDVARAPPPAASAALPPAHPFAATPGDEHGTQAAIAGLQDRFVALSAEVAQLRRQGAAPVATTEAPYPPGDTTARAAAERADRQSSLARDAAFRAEPADSSASTGTAAALRRMLDTPGDLSVAVRSVDCRSKTCRVEIAPNGATDVNEFLAGLASRMSGAGTMIVDAPDPDLAGRPTVVYLSR